jgi:OOP family OmpA-OmpF porin
MDRVLSRTVRLAAVGLLVALCGCASSSAFDQLNSIQPTGTPFQQALFGNYAHLAWSYARDSSAPRFSDIDSSMSGVADAFATKAVIAAQGHDVAPEAGLTQDQQSARARLAQALDAGRNTFPADAARAQADFDCWVLNSTVPALYASSARCRGSFASSLGRFERNLRPVAAAPTAMPQSAYTALFGFDSWSLSAEALATLQQAISDARAGRQSHINVVGHTDTVGSARYNLRLSKKRANVVRDALVDMGARRTAIVTTGVGMTDLAVPTGPGVNEPKNRRAVVTLQP